MERIAEGSLLYYIRTEKYLIKRVKSQAGVAFSAIIIIIIIGDRGMHETDPLDSVLGSGMVVGGRTESLFLIDMWYQLLPSADRTCAFVTHVKCAGYVLERLVAPWTWDGGLEKVHLVDAPSSSPVTRVKRLSQLPSMITTASLATFPFSSISPSKSCRSVMNLYSQSDHHYCCPVLHG